MKKNRIENSLAFGALIGVLLLFATFLFDGAEIFKNGVLMILGLSILCVGALCWLCRRSEKEIRRARAFVIAVRLLCLIVLMTVTSMATVFVFAADTYTYDCFELTVSSSGAYNVVATETGWSITASGVNNSCDEAETTVVTFSIKNIGKKTDGSVRSVSFKITTTGMITDSTNEEKTLNSTDPLEYTANSGEGPNSSTEITIKFEDIVRESEGVNVTTTFKTKNGGTYTVDGSLIGEDTAISKSDDYTYKLVATAANGYKFIGWKSIQTIGEQTVEKVVGLSSEFDYAGSETATIQPIFGASDSAVFQIKGTTLRFPYIDEAINAVRGSGIIVVAESGKAYHSTNGSNYEVSIPQGVTLLIPCDGSNTLYTSSPGTVTAYVKPTEYKTLTMPTGSKITVSGAISLSANQYAASGGKQNAGSPSGNVSFLKMETGSSIVVNSGASLYAWGYIQGAGSITVNEGAHVYETFQFMDYLGGTQSTKSEMETNKIFPMSQYYIQNIEVPLTCYAGASVYCSTAVNVSLAGVQQSTVKFIGSGDSMFNLSSGYFIKDYDEATDRLICTVSGEMTIDSLEVKVSAATINSCKYILPINNNMTINLISGSYTCNQHLALLPGSEVNIGPGVTFTLGTVTVSSWKSEAAELYVYDSDEWGGYCGTSSKTFVPVYVPNRTCDRTEADLVDAVLCVNGTLDASNGYLYTTEGGANICSTATGTVIIQYGEKTATYQHQYTTSSYPAIPVVSAVLRHENGKYTTSLTSETTGSQTFTYAHYICECDLANGNDANGNQTNNVAHGTWATGHTVTETTTDPKCEERGYTTYACTCGKEACVGDYAAALGHKWCTPVSEGKTQKSTCENGCGEWVALTLQYRLDTYVWMNATVELSSAMDWGEPLLEDVKINEKKYYLVKKVLSDELIDDLTVSLPVTQNTVTFDVSFLMYKNNVYEDADAETKALLDAMIAYGTAADIYFDESKKTAYENDNTKTPPTLQDANASRQDGPAAQIFGGVKLTTTGALIYFDEALRLGVQYHLTGLDANNEYVIDGKTYVVSQIGLLVLKDGDVNTPLTTTAGSYGVAYLMYDITGATQPSGGNNIPYKGYEQSLTFSGSLVTDGTVIFDLDATEYCSSFVVRPFVVLQNEADATDTHCVYGAQYEYGLEAYVTKMYEQTGSDAFKYLLAEAWDYAVAADAYIKKHPSEVTA